MFSVIIPYYKKRKYVERCINSILLQSFTDYEIILIDDGSGDDIFTFCLEKFGDKVKVLVQDNQGVSAARNTGISKASNNFIAFLDSDDYWSPFYLEKVAQLINSEVSVKIVGSNYSRNKKEVEIENSKLDYFIIENYFRTALRNSCFFTSGTVLLREFFEKEDGFNPILKSGEDMDVWFRAVLSGGNAYYIKNILVYYSDEDENQATITPKKLENRFVANAHLIYFENGKKKYSQDFYNFLSKYMYSSLYIMYFQNDSNFIASKIKQRISTKYFLAELYYCLPFKIGNVFFKSKYIRKLARNYFKFIFTYIYKR